MPEAGDKPPVQFECRVVRLEVNSEAEASDTLKWSVSAIPLAASPTPLVVVVAHLLSVHDGSWAQVLVKGILQGGKPVAGNRRAMKNFVDRYIGGFTEELYDVARRALNVNAALMDVELELPVTAPFTKVRVDTRDDYAEDPSEEALPIPGLSLQE